MIRIDLLTEAYVFFRIHTEGGRDAANRLSQRHGGAAVQNTHGLMHLGVHRHRRPEEIGAYFCHADANGIGHGLA